MEYHDINLLLKLPTLQLLRAQNAPMLLGFLHQTFKREHKVAIPEGQLRATLTAFLDELREAEPLAYPKSAADYLADWCGDGQGFLRRYYGNDANEPLFELTTGSEKALLWLESLQESNFVGTESRLESIFTGLDEILKYASADMAMFQSNLLEHEKVIRRRIEAVNEALVVIPFSDTTHVQITAPATRADDIKQFRSRLKECLRGGLQPSPDDRMHIFKSIRELISDFEKDQVWTRHVTDARNWFEFGVRELTDADKREVNYFSASSGKSSGQKAKLAFTILASAISALRSLRSVAVIPFACLAWFAVFFSIARPRTLSA